MKYPKIVEALDWILYLVGKQGISYWGTHGTEIFLAIVRQITHCYITVHPVPKCMSCHKAIVVITGRAHCFHDSMLYIMLLLVPSDFSIVCVVDPLWPLIYVFIFVFSWCSSLFCTIFCWYVNLFWNPLFFKVSSYMVYIYEDTSLVHQTLHFQIFSPKAGFY